MNSPVEKLLKSCGLICGLVALICGLVAGACGLVAFVCGLVAFVALAVAVNPLDKGIEGDWKISPVIFSNSSVTFQ